MCVCVCIREMLNGTHNGINKIHYVCVWCARLCGRTDAFFCMSFQGRGSVHVLDYIFVQGALMSACVCVAFHIQYDRKHPSSVFDFAKLLICLLR